MRPEKWRIHKRLTVIALIVSISGFFVSPRVAHAQFADVIGGPTTVTNAIKLSIGQQIGSVALQAVMNAITVFTRQFAYDMAVGLASGAKGQNPLAFLSSPGDYFNSLAQDATGELIGTLSSGTWDGLGIDLCKPQVPQVALKLQLGLAQGAGVVDRPKPKCQWQQIANNWSAIGNQIQNPNLLLQNVSLQFKPGQSDIGAAIGVESALANKILANKEAGYLKRLEGNGILPKEGLIAGNIETPAAVTKKAFEDLGDDEGLYDEANAARDIASATFGSDVWLALGKTVMSTFTNTLTQKLMQNVIGGLFQLARGGSGSGLNLNNLYALNPQQSEGTYAAQQAYSNLLVSNIKTGNGIDIITEFSTCPQKREEAGLYNCVIDSQFSAALQQSNVGNPLTVRDAIAKRFLDANKPFGFSDPLTNPKKEPDVTEGYSYSNMKKLRLARVIPVGWEFAAKQTIATGRKTLGEVIDGFAKEGTVPGCGQTQSEDPGESPFCGLVDPMWVLKVPAAQCAQQAASKLVDSSGARMDACIDLQNCVAEDGNGNCKSWGYCTKEKRSWSIGGDTCPAEYATCQGFQNTRTNAQVSYLRNTLDSTTCTSENAGCRWFSSARNVENTNWQADKRIYVNGKAQTCDATAAGCTEFISSVANLIQNSSFEKNTTAANGTVAAIEGWQWTGTAAGFAVKYVRNQNSFDGSSAVQAGGSDLSQTVRLEGALQYTLSAYGKGTDAVIIGISGAVAASGGTCVNSIFNFNPGNANEYIRSSCTFFTTPAGGNVTFAIGADSSAFVDAIQLEKGALATAYRDGYGATKQSVFLKAPPTWLGCTGEEGEPSECRSYARVCRRDEVGCEQYTPVTADPALTGTITAADRCPQECVGYAAYKQEQAAFDGPLFPQYIIPARASVCAGEDIGCAAFTNLQSEKVEYYREVRACELPAAGDNSATFVTWEGSENSGYQIKNWLLKQSPVAVVENKGTCGTDNRCSNAGSVVCRSSNDCIVNAFGEGQTAQSAPKPPCTNFELVETGGSLRMECRDTAINQATCLSGQVGVDPDCRGFYDAAGNIFYRKYSRTVLITDQCSFSRIGGTGTQLDEGACVIRGGSWNATARTCAVSVHGATLTTNLSDEIACKYGRGTWRADRQECVYAIFAPESRTCQAASLGCREYSGNAGNNVRTVFEDNFDAGVGSWVSGPSAIVQSSEAVNPGGYAVRVTPSPAGMSHAVPLEQGGTYTVDFWAKGTGAVAARFFGMPEAAPSAIVAISQRPAQLSATWQHYNFGPVTTTFASSATAQIVFDVSGASARMYIDNVVVKKVSQNLSLIAASTKNIPISCDSVSASLGGARSPQYMLGCAEYKDRANVSQYIKSFSRFCRAGSVGCAELSNTQNTEAQFGRTVNTANAGVCRGLSDTDCYYNAATDTYNNVAGTGFIKLCRIPVGATSCTYGQNAVPVINLDIDDVTVPSHAQNYLVVDSAGSCKEEQKGCQSLGQQTSSGWNTVYYKNLPDTYGETMCRHEENGCDAWTGGTGAVYFKAATGTNECAWKDNVVIAGNTYNGWFKTNAVVIDGISAKPLCDTAGGRWVQESNVCTKTDMPCYGKVTFSAATGWVVDPDPKETFLISGKTFGIWKNIDQFYRGQIASCPIAQVGCTELIDRNDCTDADRKNCTAYYVKDNDKIDKKTCRQENKVSAKDGCVLFDDTADPEKQYNTALSYQGNSLTSSAPLATGATTNNANVLLKVQLDRSCAEWLTCQSAASVFDPALGRFKLVCNSLGRCNEMVSRTDQGEIGQCANWVDQDRGDQTPAGLARSAGINAQLTRESYQKRDTKSFAVVDFSGYSIPEYYPVDRLTQVSWQSAAAPKAPNFRLAAIVPCDVANGVNCAPYDASTGVKDTAWPFLGRCTKIAEDLNDCGPKDAAGKGIGRCYANKLNPRIQTCIQNPDGSTAKVTTVAQASCRAYPDRTSPFPNDTKIKTVQSFADSTLCDDATGIGCECDYRKASYGGLKDFYYAKDTVPESKVCVGGVSDLNLIGLSENPGTKIEGKACIANSECVSGDCRALNKVTDYRGVRGYCLEEDLSRSVYGDETQHPCLTWLPTDSVVGGTDIYNQYTAAGFQPQPGNEWYCSAGFTDINARTITVNDTNAGTYFSAPRIGGNGNACGGSNNCGSSSCKDLFNNGGGWCRYPDALTPDSASVWGPNRGLKPLRCLALGLVSTGAVCRVTEDCGPGLTCGISTSARKTCSGGVGEHVGQVCTQDADCYYPCSPTLACVGGPRNGQVCSGTFVAGVPQCGTAGLCTEPAVNNARTQTNFLGEYIISDTGSVGDHIIENDWTGPGPIYRSMIETIQVGFDGYNDLGGTWVGGTVGGAGKDRGVARCNFQKGYKNEDPLVRDKNCFDNANFIIKIESGRALMVQPIFDGQSKLTSFRIQMSSPGDSDFGSVVVDSIKIILKPGCSEIRKVSEKGAYTDRLWNKGVPTFDPLNAWYNVSSTTVPPPFDRKFNPTIRYTPWGAVGPDPVKSPYVVETASQDGGIDYCKSPGSQWCGATYAKEQVKQLFAKFDSSRLSWSGSGGVLSRDCFVPVSGGSGQKSLCYTPATYIADEDDYDATKDIAGGQSKAPNIRPLGTCRDDGKCTEGATSGITIGDKSTAQDFVIGYGGLLQTTMRFYAWADKNHMPLKRIVVDWHGAKDGSIPEYDAGYQNYYRNRRGLTSDGKEQCVDEITAGKYDLRDKYGFGSILDKSCDNAYFKFQMNYTCSGKTSPFWESTSCPLPEFALRYGGCCVFKPRAKVVDGWDWCSRGTGEQSASQVNNGCTEEKGWVDFAGKVIVAPKFKQN